MAELLASDADWRLHLEKLARQLELAGLDERIHADLTAAVGKLAGGAPYRRSHLQTRFFETGDNFYLGMEHTREYDAWKQATVAALLESDTSHGSSHGWSAKVKGRAKGALAHHIDRLWYDATLETIRHGDVYNPGGNVKIPRLYLIDSLTETLQRDPPCLDRQHERVRDAVFLRVAQELLGRDRQRRDHTAQALECADHQRVDVVGVDDGLGRQLEAAEHHPHRGGDRAAGVLHALGHPGGAGGEDHQARRVGLDGRW